MGLKSLIGRQVQGAMKILGTDEDGLARKRTFVSVGTETYDAATRRTTSTQEEHGGVPMVLVRFKLDDMDDEVKPRTDRVAMIANMDLPVTPDENDKIKDGEVTYVVRRILSDPADALYRLHVRRE